MKPLVKKFIIVIASVVGAAFLYQLFLIGLFVGLYDSHSKETVYDQDTSIGYFTLVLDTGDPLSSDTWEFRIGNELIKKEYVNYSSHIDTIAKKDGITLLLVVKQSLGDIKYDVIELNALECE